MLEMNQIYHGDCLDVMKDINDNSIDLIATDPPYLINYKSNYRIEKQHDFCREIANDGKADIEIIENYVNECYRILKMNSGIYIFCSAKTIDIFKSIIEQRFNIKNIIIWVKNNWTAGDLINAYGNQYELIIYANKGNSPIKGKRGSDVWEFKRIVGNKQYHQNQKPVVIFERIINKSSNENDIVFDGFAGSGTTGVAAKNLNRNYILIEKEEKYCEIARQRLSQGVFQW